MATVPHSETGLYGSEDGRRACAQHVPYPQSDTWRIERWSAIGWSEYFDAFRIYPDIASVLMCCETCGFTPSRADGSLSPHARRTQDAKARRLRYCEARS